MDYIIGVDEVGRGCLAGDVYAAAVLAPVGAVPVSGVKDSKALSYQARAKLYTQLTACQDIQWAAARTSVAVINSCGIVKAVKGCFLTCIDELRHRANCPPVQEIVVDGEPLWETLYFGDAPTRFMPKADANVWTVSAASIIAKVIRDSYMEDLAKKYPGYGFESNRGYGTAEHIAGLQKLGLTPEHRTQFCQSALRNSDKKRPAGPDPSFDLPDLDKLFGF